MFYLLNFLVLNMTKTSPVVINAFVGLTLLPYHSTCLACMGNPMYRWLSRCKQLGGLAPVLWLEVPLRCNASKLLLALYLGGTHSLKAGIQPPSCLLLEN